MERKGRRGFCSSLPLRSLEIKDVYINPNLLRTMNQESHIEKTY